MKTRGAGWARSIAAGLARAGVSPDAISFMGMVFALAGAALFVLAGSAAGAERAILLVGAAVTIQLRLLSNLLDGMVAVEHGRGSASGPIWNELPDRIADVVFFVGAGYGAAGMIGEGVIPLGWIAAILAIMTAYVRALGQALGFPADFRGPMAKPHRMAALTLACLAAAAEPLWDWHGQSLAVGLSVIVLGSVVTVVRRTLRLATQLK